MMDKESIIKALGIEDIDLNNPEGVTLLLQRIKSIRAGLMLPEIKYLLDNPQPADNGGFMKTLGIVEDVLDIQRDILRGQAAGNITPVSWDTLDLNSKQDWLIQDWLPDNTVTLLTGHGGTGKSWLTIQLACAVASNQLPESLLSHGEGMSRMAEPYEVTPESYAPRHVVIATYEDDPSAIARRMGMLAGVDEGEANRMEWVREDIETIQQHLHLVDMRGKGSVWGPGLGKHVSVMGDLLPAGERLRKVCEDTEACLLILDPLSGGFGGNENDRSAVYDFVSSFREWGDKQNIATLLVGHLPKGGGVSFSGSTAWEASVRSMWMLALKSEKNEDADEDAPDEEKENRWYQLEHTKSNYARLQNPVYLAKMARGWWGEVTDKIRAIEAYQAYVAGYDPTPADDDSEVASEDVKF